MTNKKQHISENDFQWYLENQMTDAERNAFERKLQKHPFEAEALEGMQEISPNEFTTDLYELKAKIKTGKRKTKTRMWAAAATLLLLVSTGILWFQLQEKSPMPDITENKTIQKQEEKVAPLPDKEKEKIQKDEIIPEPEEIETTKSVQSKKQAKTATPPSAKLKSVTKESSTINPEITMQNPEADTDVANSAVSQRQQQVVVRGASRLKSSPDTQDAVVAQTTFSTDSSEKYFRGKIISLADSMPLPGATIMEKGASNGITTDINGNFKLKLSGKNDSLFTASFVGMQTKSFRPSPDSLNVIGLEPNQMALDEVVVTGYDSNQKKTLTGSNSRVTKTKDTKVQPVGGMNTYKTYLEEKAILPDNFKRNREVVKLLIHFDETGDITNIKNKNQADTVVFEDAKKIVMGGPEWNPEIKDGKPVISQTELRIVFKKD